MSRKDIILLTLKKPTEGANMTSVYASDTRSSCFNVNVLDLARKVDCIIIGYLSSKLNLLAILERNLDANQCVRLAVAVVFRY